MKGHKAKRMVWEKQEIIQDFRNLGKVEESPSGHPKGPVPASWRRGERLLEVEAVAGVC